MPSDTLPPSHQPPRRPDPVVAVWIGGIALAAVAYAVGPDHLVAAALAAFDRTAWLVSDALHNLTAAAFAAMRAAAIGLLGVFIALSLLSINRSGHGRGGLIVLTLVFLLLVWGAAGDTPAANTRWLLALLLAGLGALAATSRLLHTGRSGWRLPPRSPL